MIVNSIKLINFRNFDDINIKLNNNLNIFIGDNGQGKTNLLESIYMSSIGKTFRLNKENDLVKFNKESYNLEISMTKLNTKSKKKININYKKNTKKSIFINDVKLIKNSDIIGLLSNVIFTPDDLKIIKGSPKERRKFVNIDICQIKPKYKYLLKTYDKVISQRNKILKSNKFIDNSLLDVWNDYLVNIGTELIMYRREYIKNIKIYASNIYSNISENSEELDIKYKCNLGNIDKLTKNEIKLLFMEKLKKNKEKEKNKKISLFGPQKDDIIFNINNMEFKYFGSQGQQRSAVLALKLAEVEIIKNEIGEYPILLLDDVLSELDNKRKNYLIKYITKIQTIITSTDDYDLNNIVKDNNKKIFFIKEGKIIKIIN